MRRGGRVQNVIEQVTLKTEPYVSRPVVASPTAQAAMRHGPAGSLVAKGDVSIRPDGYLSHWSH